MVSPPGLFPAELLSGRGALDVGRGTTRAPLPGSAVGSAVGVTEADLGVIGSREVTWSPVG
jgi:hypothetical protein